MSSEPKVSLRQVTSRVDLFDYAIVDYMAKHSNRTISEYIRGLIKSWCKMRVEDGTVPECDVNLLKKWVEEETQNNANKRQEKRSTNRRGFLRRLFR